MSKPIIRQWREAMGFSQTTAAKTLGCSRAAFINWEHGHTKTPFYILLAMTAVTKGLGPWRREKQ